MIQYARMSDNEHEKIETAMNHRTQTVLIAVAMLIVTIVVSACVFIYFSGVTSYLFTKNSAIGALIFWLLTGLPSLISLAIAITLKHDAPIKVLRVSLIIYAIWYAYGVHHLFFVPPFWAGAVYFLLMSMVMFPAMIIVWIYTLVLDSVL